MSKTQISGNPCVVNTDLSLEIVVSVDAVKSLKEFVDLMQVYQHQKPNPIVERSMFNTWDNLPDKSVSVYMVSLRKVTEHCGYGEQTDSMLQDSLVCGINNEHIQQRLVSEGESLTLA